MIESRVFISMTWTEKAACKGLSHIFYSDFSERPISRLKRENAAIAICQTCPVIQECRQYAHANPEYGVWGGETEEQRILQGLSLPYGSRSEKRRAKKLEQKADLNDLSS